MMMTLAIPAWLWVMMMPMVALSPCYGCREQERIALLQLKAYFNYPNGISLRSWIDDHRNNTSDCCQWVGVECSPTTGRVSVLSLNDTRYNYWSPIDQSDWDFNASIFLPFEELRKLYLRSNNLAGWVENEGFDRLLMRLKNLEFLDLSWNRLNNSVLSSLSGFSSLKYLYLGGNQLKESTNHNSIERLSGLNNLEILDLSFNDLNNNILSCLELRDFVNLKVLDISVNNIKHFEPIQDVGRLSSLTSLEVLDLSGNHFNNSIFSSLHGLLLLKSLYIANNLLKGSTHLQDVRGLSSLEVLDFSDNYFNNNIFSSLHGLLSVKSLYIKRNLLKGSIQLEGLKNLEELDISGNKVDRLARPHGNKNLSKLRVLRLQFSEFNASKLLRSLGAFSSLGTLDFTYSTIRGTITNEDLRNLTNIEELLLEHSFVDNGILSSIGAMTSLKVLSLPYCGLNGYLPVQGWCELKNLQELDLSGNEFQGTIPSCLGNLTSLRLLDLSNNQFTGNIALSPLASLTSLKYLAFSNNHFQIPLSFRTFANHSKLEFLRGGNNKFTVEPLLHNWAPKFQLKVFDFRNFTSDKLNLAFPKFLYHQYDLRIIDLSHNYLGGTFPSWLLWNNTRLEILILRSNSFVGPVDLSSYRNPNISHIDISENNVQGQFPKNISSIFPNLELFNISRNEFYGNINFCFNHLKFLWILDLSNNNLSGIIPENFVVGCPSLEFLKLSNNNFYGHIPTTISSLTSLHCLYLNGNNFTGEVSNHLSIIPLDVLDLSNNHLSGMLPIANVIEEIDMSRNHFQGPIPIEFCELNRLKYLDLSENNLSGSIPSCFSPPDIEHLHLHKNSLQGTLPHALYNCTSLVTLDLRKNYFSGKIPDWIDRLSMLTILLLKDNHFRGEIPIQLCNLSQLSILDVSQNYLSGPIPPCLCNITFEGNNEVSVKVSYYVRMSEIGYAIVPYLIAEKFSIAQSLSFDQSLDYPIMDVQEVVGFTTKRNYYSYKGNILNFMTGIDLSSNKLVGEIPAEIGNLSKIHALNLSHNSLTGSIPTTISNLKAIESLDLSYNKLNGRIPSQLTELNSLEVFSVAHNNLSGKTPERKAQFATFEESSYEGNPLLCGPPLPNDCVETILPPNDDGDDASFVDMGVFYESFTVSYIIVVLAIVAILYINPYWRRAWFYLVEVCITTCYYFIVDL